MNVSVIIPTYNRPRETRKAIDSVLAQTDPVAEIIVVDDGSTDGTYEQTKSHYGATVKIIRQDNAGAAAARNRGLREARCEWIALLDSDDEWFPRKIECQNEAIRIFGDKAGVCFTDNLVEGNPDQMVSMFEESGFKDAGRFGILEDPAARILEGREPFYTPSFVIRRSLLSELGGFDETLFVREDTDLFFRLCFKTKFCYVGEPLYKIDRRPIRKVALSNSYSSGDHRVWDSYKKLYTKWLAMEDVAGTKYEPRIKDLQRNAYYSSAESMIHQLRIADALREVGDCTALGENYLSVGVNLLTRKIRKLLHRMNVDNRRPARIEAN